METWNDSKRDDLNNIPLMQANGFKTNFAYQDIMYKRTTPQFVPQFSVNFVKDDLHVWKIKSAWQTAILNDNGNYVDHKPFKTLQDVLDNF